MLHYPIEMLNSPNLTDKMLISKEIKMNDRMQNIADRLQALDTENITEEKRNKKKRKLQRASEIVNELFLRFLNTRQNFTATAYAWADIAPLKEDSGLDSKIIKNRLFQLAIQDVKHWLELCSDKHSQIKAIIKGHQHYIENTILSDRRVIVYTLSTGMDTCYFKDYPQPDKSLLLTTQEKIKQAFLRKSGCNGMAITEEYPFYAQKEIRFSQITPNGTIQPLSEKDTKLSTEDNPIIPI